MNDVVIRPAHSQLEISLLLACARATEEHLCTSQISRLAQSGLDWQRLMDIAEQHGTTALLYKNLRRASADVVPPQVLAQLQNVYHEGAQGNLLKMAELFTILELFEEQRIPSIPLKGPTLAYTAYGNLSLRRFDDLDILIHQQDFQRAKRALAAHGYRPNKALSDTEEEAYLRSHHDFSFVRADNHVMLDIQWGIIQEPFTFPRDVRYWWDSAQTITIAGRAIRCLSPELLLLMLCVHGSKHLWERLIWVCDIAEVIRVHHQMDWDLLMQNASKTGAERMLLVGLLIAHTLLDAPVPASILRQAQANNAVRSLTTHVCNILLLDDVDSDRVINDAPLFYLTMMERIQDRARLLLRFYPSMLHPIRAVRKYGMRPLQHLLGL